MKAYLSRRYRISASHRLNSSALDPERNAAVYGKCNNPHGHGHNYVVEVTLGGQVDEQTGMVCNLADLDRVFVSEIAPRYHHANLNMVREFENAVPTTENLCKSIFSMLAPFFPGSDGPGLERIRVEETVNNSFEYAGKEQR